MRGKGRHRGVSLLRAFLVSALVGHWVANALFDRDEYAGADPSTIGHLYDPILVQTALVLLAALALTIWERRRRGTGGESVLAGVGFHRLLGFFLVSQLLLFLGMEITERLAIGTLFGEPFYVGMLGSGFVAELLVAVGSVFLLALLGAATTRLVEALRSRDGTAGEESRETFLPHEFPRPPRVLAGAGGVRSPPTL